MNKDILYKFFEGNASFEEEAAVKQWMEESAENRLAFLKERKLFDAMLLLGNEEIIKNGKKRFSINLSSLRTELIKIAAVVAITLGGSYFYYQSSLEKELMAMQTITVPAGQRINITLVDGTNVWLNARTSLSYPVKFGKNNRQVVLDGEAYFDVTKDKSKPFIVQTDNYNVEVLGTKFDVNAYSETGEFETTLMSGSVKVASASDSTQKITLKPNNKVYLQDGKLHVTAVDDYNPYRWKEGLICFKNETFTSIMKDFEKYYGLTIQVKNKNVFKYVYTGKFRQTDGIDYALRVLQKDIKFTYQRDDENQIIYIE
ncbi:anti-sigma factor [Parabacteroides goldsteinii]|jgi:ferric-dicitrate binding protein FerR (iron transport regulator)|uniref:FecR family protein n=1 Tax=Parabacteroides segnis TaxID=2763058 RepID=A0ABR7E2A6_9BACT|nr:MULTISPECIES: FecR family protein [Parabacteroides]MBC5643902.1 FecR family protein [Parabacteroides segnis]MCM0711843.1 FecR family protein [Parabacteroides sp. TA-V-105]MCM0717401.1 FecR family protein [Parabacteroides sp. W1-Q-101]GKG71683.1 anti-sigma factor [Parabacteroides goldsteinii]GKG77618.1 anti-sigma factor [Parabacteroides goldsteinii]